MIQSKLYGKSAFRIRRGLPYGLIALILAAAQPLVAAESSHKVCLRNALIDTAPTVSSFRKTGNPSDKFSDGAAALLSSGQEAKPIDLIIQFTGPIREEWKQLIAVYGDARTYIPDNALLIRTTTDRLHSLAALEPVQWIGVLKPEHKIQPGLLTTAADIGSQKPPIPLGPEATNALRTAGGEIIRPDGRRVVHIRLFAAEDTDAVAAAIRRMDGEVLGIGRGPRQGTIRARMRLETIAALAGLPEVEWIERFRQPRILNNVSAGPALMNANSAHTNFGLTGHGQVIAVCDTGLDTGDTNTLHPDFTNRLRAAFGWARPGEWSDLMGHGTHVAGSVLGNGSAWSNGLYEGIAYGAELVFQSCGDAGSSIFLPDDLNDLYIQAYTNDARIHSDSWGGESSGEYTIECQQSDEFIWNHPEMLIVFSAGNEGVDEDGDGVVDLRSIGAPALAKNVLAVGAAISDREPGSGGYSSYTWGEAWGNSYFTPPVRDGHISEPWDGIHQGMAAFSSRGPCSDGRVKPDIVAPGTDIISCRSRMPDASTLWGTGKGVLANAASNYYTFCGGTSMATPLTAGAAGVARQYLVETRGLANPSAALIKALMTAGARTLAPGQYGLGRTREIPFGSRPNVVEGWGHVDLGNTLFPENGTNILVNGDTLATGAMKTYRFASSGTNRLAIVLAWSDYPASPLAAASLVNDLDLQVLAPDGTIYYPNGLHGPDRTNNVEGMDIYPTQAGIYEILALGWNVPHGPQPFALVIHEAPATDCQIIDGLWHEPAPVTNGAGISVKATIIPNASGLAAVSAVYRVNGGAWATQAMALTNSAGYQLTYAATLPAFNGGDRVEYLARAFGRDSEESASVTNAFTVWGAAFYVSPTGSTTPPYDTPATGFTNIMEAILQADPNMTIMVDRGTYRESLSVATPLTLRSLYGAAETIIDGDSSRCCLWISDNASVDGFTFAHGYAATNAGGVNMTGGSIRNCVIRDNTSLESAGGANITYGGRLNNSLVCHNSGLLGGLLTYYGGQCGDCLFISNTASAAGGGVGMFFGGAISNCVIQANTAAKECGGLLMGNFISFSTSAKNCLITDNVAPTSAAVEVMAGGVLENCTIAGNHGLTNGAFLCAGLGLIYNTIIYGNTPENCAFESELAIMMKNCCTLPAVEEGDQRRIINQIAADPKFRHAAAGDYRLCADSPCRDAGTNMDWMSGAVDLEGNARIINGIVDIGAYELLLPHEMWNFAAGRNAFADYDNDGLMDPAVYNPVSGLWIISLSGQNYRQTISQLGGTGYTVVPGDYNGDRRTELAVYQEAAGLWILQGNPASFAALGGPGWRPVPGDYDGDGKADPLVYNSIGQCQALLSACGYGLVAGSLNMTGAQPVFGDFDGDERVDPVMYLERECFWGMAMSGSAYAFASITSLGGLGWTPAVADYDGDGRADPAVYQETTGVWHVLLSNRNYTFVSIISGGPGYKPVPGDYDGDAKADPAIYNNSTGTWMIACSRYGYRQAVLNLGGPAYIAVNANR